MCVRLFFCLVLLTTITANDFTTSEYESASRYVIYNEENIRKLIQSSIDDSSGGAAEGIKHTNNMADGITQGPMGGQNKNGTASQKPDTEKEGMDAESSHIVSYPPYAPYEVTENVSDIPDDRTPAGPIITNYTARPILNVVRPVNKTEKDKVTEANIKTKKNRVNILHINVEYDDKNNEVNENKAGGLFKGIKEYIQSFHRGIVKGIHSFFHKKDDVHEREERFERSVDRDDSHVEDTGKNNVDKTEYFVRQ